MFFTTLKLALLQLLANKKQGVLTMLGVIIGIASVITVVSIGSGAQSLITNQISKIGTNLLAVFPGKAEEGSGPPPIARGIVITTLKQRDAEDIAEIPEVVGVVPINFGNGIATYRNKSEAVPFWGTGQDYASVSDIEMRSGRFLSEREINTVSRVVVLGPNIKQKLFGDDIAEGKTIKLNQKSFTVIGVLEAQGSSFFINQDDYLFIPYTTAQKQVLGIDYLHFMRVKTARAEDLEYVREEMKKILRKNHNINDPKNDDFTIRLLSAALDILGSVTDGLKLFLAAIAGISLIVGGVGIMNMMLVSVTKRTREIGLRKAIGAKRSAIIFQFLVESCVITTLGGIIGIFVGVFVSWGFAAIIQSFGYDWTFIVSLDAVAIAFSISMAIGIIFGMYPAVKASKLNPIDALRYE